MSELEAREFLHSAGSDLCVRFIYDDHGRIFFREQTLAPSLLVRARRAATIAALPLAAAACDAPSEATYSKPRYDEIMGPAFVDDGPRHEAPPNDDDAGSPDPQSPDAGSDAQPDGDAIFN